MRIKRVASWAIPLLVVVALAYLFGYSNFLTVKSIKVNEVAQRSDIQRVISSQSFNIKIGAKLARVNVRGAQKAISSIGWVADAKVSRNWITGRVSISANARKAVAAIASNSTSGALYVDSGGFIYQDPSITESLPVITIADSKLARAAAQFVTALPTYLLGEMKNLSLDGAGEFIMQENLGSKTLNIRWGSALDLDTKVKIYEKLIALPENKNAISIDLSDPKYPIVKNN